MNSRLKKFLFSDQGVALIIIGSLLLSMIILSTIEHRTRTQLSSQNLWQISFDNPKGDDLSFSIENNTADEDFRWAIFDAKNELLGEMETKIPSGSQKSFFIPPQTSATEQLTIRVFHGREIQEIYKVSGIETM